MQRQQIALYVTVVRIANKCFLLQFLCSPNSAKNSLRSISRYLQKVLQLAKYSYVLPIVTSFARTKLGLLVLIGYYPMQAIANKYIPPNPLDLYIGFGNVKN